MFYRAKATGLPMLGGYDVYAKYRDTKVRAHYWRADDKVHEPQHELIVLLVAFGDLSEAIVHEIANR